MNDKNEQVRRPRIYQVIESRQSPESIEEGSFSAIDEIAGERGVDPAKWRVIQRMVHATADFSLIDDVTFSDGAIDAALEAIRRGAPIYVDSNMIRAGISVARLKDVCGNYSAESIHCHIADADVAAEAKKAGLPRSLYAVRKAAKILDGGIALFGNAPVALLELNRMIIEGEAKPAFVIAMPVGFVHVVESKEELMSLETPYVAVRGRRGGSPLAVAALHAICSLHKNPADGEKLQ